MSDSTTALLFPAFLYGDHATCRRKMKAEAKKWVKLYDQRRAFPEPVLIPVPPGSRMICSGTLADLIALGTGAREECWFFYLLDELRMLVNPDSSAQRAAFQANFEAFASRYSWGSLSLALRSWDESIDLVSRRLEAVLSFWESLDTLKYRDTQEYSFADLMHYHYEDVIRTWVDAPAGTVRENIRAAMERMRNASEDEIHSRMMRGLHQAVDTSPDLKHRDWLKSPGLIETEVVREAEAWPDRYESLRAGRASAYRGFLGDLDKKYSEDGTGPSATTSPQVPSPYAPIIGGRGHTVHVHNGQMCNALRHLGHRVAIVGTNKHWTSFIPLDAPDFDAAEASGILGHPVVHVWFDEDTGVVLQVYSAGELLGEFSLYDDVPSKADLDFLNKLEELGLLRARARKDLLRRISKAADVRNFMMMHGLERWFEMPFYCPIPAELPEAECTPLLPESAKILSPVKATKVKRKPRAQKQRVAPSGTPKTSWNEKETATIVLHCAYWCDVFCFNNWTLGNRYKKHLPADERKDVEGIYQAIFERKGDDEVAKRVYQVLARIWECEDWDEVIRSPKLIDGNERAWEKWVARVSRS